LILGFIVTTGGGSILNYIVQTESSRRDQSFEMYKTRMEEAKSLQKEILEHIPARLFYIQTDLLDTFRFQPKTGRYQKVLA